ncbi:unnamed protein product, partial [marine sediment metagenome]
MYVLYRLGKKGAWLRLKLDRPEVPVSSLEDGNHILQLQAVEDGVVYQRTPTEVRFTIRRDRNAVLKKVIALLTSHEPESERLAVEFLSFQPEPYLERLQAELSAKDHALFLLRAARDRATYAGTMEPVMPERQWLVREEDGHQVWDFSRFPSLNPWYSKEMLRSDE